MTESFLKVKQSLSELPNALKDKVLTGATRAAAQVIADEAKRRVPVRTGLLKKSIGTAKAKKKDTKSGQIKFYVITKTKVATNSKVKLADGRSGKMKIKQFSFYAHMVEFGTSKMAAKPYMRPAMQSAGPKSVLAFQAYALKRADREIAKLKK